MRNVSVAIAWLGISSQIPSQINTVIPLSVYRRFGKKMALQPRRSQRVQIASKQHANCTTVQSFQLQNETKCLSLIVPWNFNAFILYYTARVLHSTLSYIAWLPFYTSILAWIISLTNEFNLFRVCYIPVLLQWSVFTARRVVYSFLYL